MHLCLGLCLRLCLRCLLRRRLRLAARLAQHQPAVVIARGVGQDVAKMELKDGQLCLGACCVPQECAALCMQMEEEMRRKRIQV